MLGDLVLRSYDEQDRAFPQNELPIWQQEKDPEIRVDAFLDHHAGLFLASDQAWKQVRIAQDQLHAFVVKRVEHKANTATLSRRERRNTHPTKAVTNDPRTFFGMAKLQAQQMYKDAEFEPKDPIEARVQSFAKFMDKLDTERQDALEASIDPSLSIADVKDQIANFNNLIDAHLWRQMVEDVAISQLALLLSDKQTTEHFVARIKDLSEAASVKIFEYPGLLELLALHFNTNKQENIIQAAMTRFEAQPAEYARDFLDAVQERSNADVSDIVQMLKLSANFDQQNPGSETTYLDWLSNKIKQWPTKLQVALKHYSNARNRAAIQDVEDYLHPSFHPGRLPTKVQKDTRLVIANGSPTKAKARKRGPQHEGTTLEIGKTGQNHEDIVEATEKEPISRFATLHSSGGSQKNTFTLGKVETIEGIFEESNFMKYIDNHREDKTLEAAMREALSQLASDPFNRDHTAPLVTGKYSLSGKRRRLQRLSLQHYPGISTGSIASKTRIIYDVITHENEPVIVIYGAVFKQDSEKIDGLPKR